MIALIEPTLWGWNQTQAHSRGAVWFDLGELEVKASRAHNRGTGKLEPLLKRYSQAVTSHRSIYCWRRKAKREKKFQLFDALIQNFFFQQRERKRKKKGPTVKIDAACGSKKNNQSTRSYRPQLGLYSLAPLKDGQPGLPLAVIRRFSLLFSLRCSYHLIIIDWYREKHLDLMHSTTHTALRKSSY